MSGHTSVNVTCGLDGEWHGTSEDGGTLPLTTIDCTSKNKIRVCLPLSYATLKLTETHCLGLPTSLTADMELVNYKGQLDGYDRVLFDDVTESNFL